MRNHLIEAGIVALFTGAVMWLFLQTALSASPPGDGLASPDAAAGCLSRGQTAQRMARLHPKARIDLHLSGGAVAAFAVRYHRLTGKILRRADMIDVYTRAGRATVWVLLFREGCGVGEGPMPWPIYAAMLGGVGA